MMKIKRKSNAGITKEDIEKAVRKRLDSVEGDYYRRVIYESLDTESKASTVRKVQQLFAHGGSCANGFWETGHSNHFYIKNKDNYELTIKYPEVTNIIIELRERGIEKWQPEKSNSSQKTTTESTKRKKIKRVRK